MAYENEKLQSGIARYVDRTQRDREATEFAELADTDINSEPSLCDSATADSEASPEPSRLDFRHASSHLSHKRPGYYLILLRSELRHRSLREKPTIMG